MKELRGNLDTRLRKLEEGEYDAIILACAGLTRLGWSAKIIDRLPIEKFVPAPGQGALALEIRASDNETEELLLPLNDIVTSKCLYAERALQTELNAGCTMPVGAHCILENGKLMMRAMMAEIDGSNYRSVIDYGDFEYPADLGRRVAKQLLY